MAMFEELRMGNVVVRPAQILAPMAGITDTVFRRFVKRLGGCGLVMTEFVSSEGLLRQNLRSRRYLYYREEEHPIAAQLFGAEAQRLADAARMVEDLGFDVVDLNLGCPARKVVKYGGSALLRELPLLERILKSIRAAVGLPFTVKMRAGWSEQEIVAVEVARLAEACGVDGIAVHPRTRTQGLSGRANWHIIADVKANVRIPVIGNGDVFTPQDAQHLFEQTGCDGVMIGRAAATNPWIFRQIEEYRRSGTYVVPSAADRHQLICTYYHMLAAEETPGALGKMKQFASRFTHGIRNGAELRRHVYSAREVCEVLERVDEFFRPLAMPGRTAQ
jgi:nifR3 family TIM-barrel protein